MWSLSKNTVPNGRDECCKPLIFVISIHMMRLSKIWSFCLSLIILWIMLSDKQYIDISYLSIIWVGHNLFYKNQYSYFAGTTFIFHTWTVHLTVLPPVFFFSFLSILITWNLEYIHYITHLVLRWFCVNDSASEQP